VPTILRIIRRSLLSSLPGLQTGTYIRKYFLYAIGEVGLVMIGILLALQVNNWNNKRKDRIEEQLILENLRVDFQSNLEQLQDLNVLRRGMASATQKIFEIVDSRHMILDETELDSIVAQTTFAPKFNNNSATLSLMLSNGKLDLIQNNELKSLLMLWNGAVDELTEDELRIDDISHHQYRPTSPIA